MILSGEHTKKLPTAGSAGAPYREMMERMELTPEMRARILEHVQQADLSPDQAAREQKKVTTFASRRKYVGMAAGLVVLIAACAVMPAVLTKNGDQNPDQTPDENVQVTWDYQEYDSAQALSAQMGYEVSDLKALPFEPQTVVYASIGTDLAQIEYETDDISVCYRKSPGTEENSGDYNRYEKIDTVSAGDVQVELRGSENGYVLAVWTDGAYAYSLSFSQAQPKDVWMQLLETNITPAEEK